MIKEGYLPFIKTTDGILIGEAVVTNSNGICHVYAINTTTEDFEVEIPSQELIPFDYYELRGEHLE